MSSSRVGSSLVVGLCVLGAIAACTKPPAPMAPRPVPGTVNTDSINRARADSAARADSIRMALERQQREADSLRALRELEAQAAANKSSDALDVLRQTIYFDYDQFSITDNARAQLDAKVAVLKAQPNIALLITGHTDDRGSTEYNIALGLRRAAEIKSYLVASGVESGRIEVTSMGEERPAVPGDNEAAWSKNRRAEFAPSTR